MGQGVEALAELSRKADLIVSLNQRVLPGRAEEEFRKVLGGLEDRQLAASESVLRRALESFLPKRRRALESAIAERLARARQTPAPDAAPEPTPSPSPSPTPLPVPVPSPPSATPAPPPHRAVNTELTYNKQRLSSDLEDLSNHHIFQWATFYRDTLSQYFDAFLDVLASDERPRDWLNLTKAALSDHAREIFSRGFDYQTVQHQATVDYARAKSLSGLQRFLDLPLEFYSARLAESQHAGAGLRLRQLASAMVSGILIGYSHAQFDEPGQLVLSRSPGSWVHVLPFLTAQDLREVTAGLEHGDLADGVDESVLPFAKAIDDLARKDRSTAPLPAFSQYSDSSRRLEIQLQFAPNAAVSRRVDVHCYTSRHFVDRDLIEGAASRGVGAVLAPLRPDLRIQLLNVERFSDIVVPTAVDDYPHERLVAILEDQFHDTAGKSTNRIINFNFAEAFPLENPFNMPYNHVYRSSVRGLMAHFERRNGVRLWCSVRRSGKTTACASDLGSTTGQTTVLTQTCDKTGQIADGDVFFKAVVGALDAGERLRDDFVTRTVADCLSSGNENRVVLVLDEYETLFGNLRSAMERDSGTRYRVVQPLLNQIVEFTRENLLILVGQQPTAHWILTDQNQLSPVVIQDSFPLFTHAKAARSTGEFEELLQRIMSPHVQLEDDFVDAVYEEAGGHPFLTAKMLVAFWDWLIERRLPFSALSPVRAELFRDFAQARLTRRSIAYTSHYDMFKTAAADHLSPTGRTENPWLHSVYSAMRRLALDSPETFSMPVAQFEEMAERYSAQMSPADLLTSGAHANFLTLDNGLVRPRIRVLARIAGAVRPIDGGA